MAINGITDIVEIINVPKSEYENLIRESETLAIIKDLYKAKKYVDADDMRRILNVELEVNGGNE